MARTRESSLIRIAGLRYWRAADAAIVVEAWQRSGERVAAFSRRHGLHPRRVRRWIAVLASAVSDESVRFHPVRLVATEPAPARGREPIEIVLASGATVRVPVGTGTDDLERVLAAVTRTLAC